MKPTVGRIVHYTNLGDKDGKYPPQIVAGAWLFDGAGAPATPIKAPMSQRLAQAQPWERTALTLEVEPPYDAGGLRPDQERLLDWMVASLDKPEQP